MPIAYWRDEYKTGNDVLDDQHKHLFKIVNTLHDAMLEGHGRDVLQKTLDELIAYTIEHFRIEEKLMESSHYPDYEEHKAKHDDLKSQVTVLLEKMKQQNNFLSIEVSKFLTNWLIHHIMGSDQKMIKFFKEQNFSLAEQVPPLHLPL